MKKIAVVTLFVAVIADLALLLSGRRLLISETRVEPGSRFVLQDYGDVGDATQATLVCRYFTGRSILTRVFWFSPNNILGRDECPVVIEPNDT